MGIAFAAIHPAQKGVGQGAVETCVWALEGDVTIRRGCLARCHASEVQVGAVVASRGERSQPSAKVSEITNEAGVLLARLDVGTVRGERFDPICIGGE